MFRKKNGSKKLFENMPVEPDEVQHQGPESTQAHEEHKTEPSDQTEAEERVTSGEQASVEADQSAAEAANSESDVSDMDILEDVRRSLIEEEEAHQKEEQPKWWKRIGKKSHKNIPQPEPPWVEEINLPGLDVEITAEESMPEPEIEIEEDTDTIDELINMLDQQEIVKHKPIVEEQSPEPEKVVDIEELKKQAFQPRPTSAREENLTEVRSIALEGGEDVFVEVQSTPQDPLEERLSAMENALKPYRRSINFGLAVLGLVMAGIAALVLFNIYRQSVAASAAQQQQITSNLPYPVSVSLPGGWAFQLGKGSLTTDGRWNPKQAEWLQGTEVCRWVALPWSKQLEAVLRTLNSDDPIQLQMSNNDVLTYKVFSIKQLSPEEMQQLDSNTPCLLVVLPEEGAEKRWVLTALP